MYMINAGKLATCPKIETMFGDIHVEMILDTGSQVSVLSNDIFLQLKLRGPIMELPAQSVVLMSAFGNKTSRVKRQALISFTINGDEFENNFLISPQLISPGILGADFLYEYKFSIDLGSRHMTRVTPGEGTEVRRYELICKRELNTRDEVIGKMGESQGEVLKVKTVNCDGRALLQPSLVRTPTLGVRKDRRCEYSRERKFLDESGCSEGEKLGEETNVDGIERMEVEILSNDEVEEEGEEICGNVPVNDDDNDNDGDGDSDSDNDEDLHPKIGLEELRQPQVPNADDVIDEVVETAHLRSAEQREEVRAILRKYQESFSSTPGLCVNFEYGFELTDHAPFSYRERPVPYAIRDAVREQMEMMIRQGIIEPATSPYSNPLVVVPKANKVPRICLDARRLNAVTIADSERTQPIQELLQQFDGVQFLSSLDLTAAFLQISMRPDCRKYTAFLFNSQQYQFCRMTYGLKNSGCALIRAMRRIFGPETHGYLCQYIDDLYIHTNSYEEHLERVEFVLRRLSENGFTINLNKCKFFRTSIEFLGHIIGNKGVSPDPDRIASILNYPAPKNQKQLRQFLGTCNFHHRFIINYAEYAAHLVPLLKKGVRWKWDQDHEEAFLKLRNAFAASIHLAHPRSDLIYEIYTDSSCYAISGILAQTDEKGQVSIITTASRVLSPTERRYTTCEQVLLAVVFALQKFRIYVYGRKVKLYTDNKSVSFLGKCVITSNRVARWALRIQEYDLTLVHIAGTKNHFADVLSRNPAGLTPEQVIALKRPQGLMIARIDLGLDMSIRRGIRNLASIQDRDPDLQEIRRLLKEGCVNLTGRFLMHENLLYTVDTRNGTTWKVVIPRELEEKLITYVHLAKGHAGTDKCVRIINEMFHLKNLGRKTRKLLACCEVCQKVKFPNSKYDVENRPHLPERKGQLVSVDFYGPAPRGRGGVRYLFMCLDVFTKFIKLYPLKSATTKACLQKITDNYIPYVVKPETILSDHGTQYTSRKWIDGVKQFGINVRFTPIRNPQSNPVERFMREIGKACRIYCEDNHKKWPELIPHLESWINETVSEATGFTPRELMYGGNAPRLFSELLPTSPEEERELLTSEQKAAQVFARLKKRAEKRERRVKRGRCKWDPSVGEEVLVEASRLSDANRGLTHKFARPYEGPFCISRIVSPAIFEISDSKGKIRGMFSKGALKKFKVKDPAT
jgi:hypothetical protein